MLRTGSPPQAAGRQRADTAAKRRRGMRNYVLRRIGLFLVTAWAAITLAFLLFRLMPGDPISIMLAQLSLAQGKNQAEGAQKIVETYRAMFGLDLPIYVQYIYFFRNILNGFNFGPSFVQFPTQAQALIMRALPWTIGLFSTSMLLAWLLGTIVGTGIGWLRRTRFASLAAGLLTLL
jgi:peptide/nickel transport system permease protein